MSHIFSEIDYRDAENCVKDKSAHNTYTSENCSQAQHSDVSSVYAKPYQKDSEERHVDYEILPVLLFEFREGLRFLFVHIVNSFPYQLNV